MIPDHHVRNMDDIPRREVILSQSGLDFLKGMLAGTIPHPAMAATIGCRILTAEEGRVTFAARPTLAHSNPMSAVHGGWYGTVLDTVLGCTVMSRVPKGRWYTTLEYKVNLLRALPLECETVAEGFSDHAGRSTAVAHAEIRGKADGRLYATGSTTCIILS